jgi:HTH-type transcriptional regulator, global nitrogen regulator NrpRI
MDKRGFIPMINSAMEHSETPGSEIPPSRFGRSGRARLAILKALDELDDSAGGSKISEIIGASGMDLQARTVRFHLLRMDREGLTKSASRHEGRRITEKGKKELARCGAAFKIGFIASKMDELAYRMCLDTGAAAGTIVANAAFISKHDLSRAIHFMNPVFKAGLSLGDRIAIRMWAGRGASGEVPRGKILLSTVSNVTLSGIFMKAGIPLHSRFAGLVEMENGHPKRFAELIEYRGTSMDPHKIFIRANMTKVGLCAAGGAGAIGACFCEFSTVAMDGISGLLPAIKELQLNCILAIGQPGRPLLDIPVGEGRTAMIIADGLNPFAALHEAGIPVEINSLSGLEDIRSFVPFNDVIPMGKRSIFVE